jgi:microcystin degradation protein MlrC
MITARVAITGYMHEVNAFAPPITRRHGLQVADSPGGLAETWEAGAAIRRLRELRDVEIVELPVWEFGASGPLDDADFTTVVDEVIDQLRAAGPVDGVLVLGHGAGRTDTDLDSDATFLHAVRDVVGPDIPLVVVLDFHANVSPAMCDLADVLVGYRTNPHVDIEDRSIEAADHLHRLLEGGRTVRSLSRPPLLLPQLAQNTTPGEPLAEVVALAESAIGGAVLNVSVFGGFSLADVRDCGLTVVVTADAAAAEAADTATTIAADVAGRAWVLRDRYRTQLTPLADAVRIAGDAVSGRRSPVVLADTADNPGGGAPGNATFVLEALLTAGLDGASAPSHHHVVVLGLHCDRAVVEAAWEAGEGAHTRVEFNAGSADPLARPLAVDATVVCLQDGPLVPTTGVYRGMERHPGRCCALQIGGIAVAVSSHKVQCADDDTLLHVGLDPRQALVTVVKSRGHFRAGFAHLVADDQIVEVGAPGVAPAVLDGIAFTNISRPVAPLDIVDEWVPAATLHGARVMR